MKAEIGYCQSCGVAECWIESRVVNANRKMTKREKKEATKINNRRVRIALEDERGDVKIPKNLSKMDRIVFRDGDCCFYCKCKLNLNKGEPSPHPDATFEHLIAKAHGGTRSTDNLVLACKPCNSRAGSMPLEDKLELRVKHES